MLLYEQKNPKISVTYPIFNIIPIHKDTKILVIIKLKEKKLNEYIIIGKIKTCADNETTISVLKIFNSLKNLLKKLLNTIIDILDKKLKYNPIFITL